MSNFCAISLLKHNFVAAILYFGSHIGFKSMNVSFLFETRNTCVLLFPFFQDFLMMYTAVIATSHKTVKNGGHLVLGGHFEFQKPASYDLIMCFLVIYYHAKIHAFH